MKDRLTNPVRMTFSDTGRAEGWGTYLEEMLLQAGLTDDNPRARELFYIALIKRGSGFQRGVGGYVKHRLRLRIPGIDCGKGFAGFFGCEAGGWHLKQRGRNAV